MMGHDGTILEGGPFSRIYVGKGIERHGETTVTVVEVAEFNMTLGREDVRSEAK